MLLVWRGWGLLVIPIIAAVASLISFGLAILVSAVGLDLPKGKGGALVMAVGLLVAAVANWFIGRRLNRRTERVLVDAQTGQQVVLTSSHTLFFIKMEYWSVPVALLAALLFGAAFK